MDISQQLATLIQVMTKNQDVPLNSYVVNDNDTAGTTKYYGNTNRFGHWYILKNDSTAGTYRYASNTKDVSYISAWTNRATLDYHYFHETSF